MSDVTTLAAEARAEAGKGPARALRRGGKRARIDDSDDDDEGSDAGSDAGAGGDSPAPARAVASRSQSKQASPWAPARARQPGSVRRR